MDAAVGAYADRDTLLKTMGFASYADYQTSQLWRETRKKVFKRDGHKCRICNTLAKVVHHDDYRRETIEGMALKALYSLCRDCHEKIEFSGEGEGRKKRTFSEVRAELRRLLLQPAPLANCPKIKKRRKKREKREAAARENGFHPTAKDLMAKRFEWKAKYAGQQMPHHLKLAHLRKYGVTQADLDTYERRRRDAAIAEHKNNLAAAELSRTAAEEHRARHAEEFLPTFELRVLARVAMRNAGVSTLTELFALFSAPKTDSQVPIA